MAISMDKCARCGKIYHKIRSTVCAQCQDAEDADYEKIRDVLCYEPTLTPDQVAEAAEVELACVMRMINEGLITSVSLSEPAVCGRCGAPAISLSKRLCQSCLEKLSIECAEALRAMREAQMEREGYYGVHRTVERKRRTPPTPGSPKPPTRTTRSRAPKRTAGSGR